MRVFQRYEFPNTLSPQKEIKKVLLSWWMRRGPFEASQNSSNQFKEIGVETRAYAANHISRESTTFETVGTAIITVGMAHNFHFPASARRTVHYGIQLALSNQRTPSPSNQSNPSPLNLRNRSLLHSITRPS